MTSEDLCFTPLCDHKVIHVFLKIRHRLTGLRAKPSHFQLKEQLLVLYALYQVLHVSVVFCRCSLWYFMFIPSSIGVRCLLLVLSVILVYIINYTKSCRYLLSFTGRVSHFMYETLPICRDLLNI